jgi:hypothetical protein
VERTLDLLQELADIVVTEARPQAEITSLNTKRFFRSRLDRCVQRSPKVLVHDLLEWPPGAPSLAAQLGGYVIVEG